MSAETSLMDGMLAEVRLLRNIIDRSGMVLDGEAGATACAALVRRALKPLDITLANLAHVRRVVGDEPLPLDSGCQDKLGDIGDVIASTRDAWLALREVRTELWSVPGDLPALLGQVVDFGIMRMIALEASAEWAKAHVLKDEEAAPAAS